MEGTLDSATLTNSKESRHNKPKKRKHKRYPKRYLVPPFPFCYITFYVINVAHLYILPNYVCTAEDFVVIESIMYAPKNTNFVEIGDASLSNDHLKCLTCDDGFLPDDVSQQEITMYTICVYF
jgi:hypothetical protein